MGEAPARSGLSWKHALTSFRNAHHHRVKVALSLEWSVHAARELRPARGFGALPAHVRERVADGELGERSGDEGADADDDGDEAADDDGEEKEEQGDESGDISGPGEESEGEDGKCRGGGVGSATAPLDITAKRATKTKRGGGTSETSESAVLAGTSAGGRVAPLVIELLGDY